MATERANDLHAFKTFIDEQLASANGAQLKLDEALARWEHENETDKRQETPASIRQGLADADAERTIPAGEIVAELRKKHGVTTDARTLQSNPEEWVERLQAWVDSHPVEQATMDDSRESIYAGRGE
jgi:hypothetical protein